MVPSPTGMAASSTGVAGSAGQVDTWAPSLRRLTPQVVVQAGRPHCHLSGPAAQERVTTTSKRAHRPTRAQSGARAQNHGVNVQTLPTRRREQMPPPSIPTFPHQKAKKSRYQQHAVSYNPNPQPPLEPRPGITKPPGPNWGRAAVAVALGFEPRVAVTPHSISSAAPSAARTRYLTQPY